MWKLLQFCSLRSLSTAAQPTRYWDRNTPAGSLWELHCLFLISLQCFYWNVCPQVSASHVFFSFHLRWSPGLGVAPFILPLFLWTCLTGRVCVRVELYVSVCVWAGGSASWACVEKGSASCRETRRGTLTLLCEQPPPLLSQRALSFLLLSNSKTQAPCQAQGLSTTAAVAPWGSLATPASQPTQLQPALAGSALWPASGDLAWVPVQASVQDSVLEVAITAAAAWVEATVVVLVEVSVEVSVVAIFHLTSPL